MTKILGWGTVIYLIVLGYSFDQHAMFEYCPSDEQKVVVQAKKDMAKELRTKSNSLNDSDKIESAKLRVKAAESDLEARISDDDMRDGRVRAISLVLGVLGFFILYFSLVFMFYQKYNDQMLNYVFPKRAALIYVALVGTITLVLAILLGR